MLIRRRVVFQKEKEVIREIPGEGKILVKKGERVKKEDVIAEVVEGGEILVFDLCALLGAKRPVSSKILCKKIGEEVKKGERIAQVGSFLFGKKILLAPSFGQILVLKQTGKLLFRRKGEKKRQVFALFEGKVKEISERKIVLKASFLEIRGIKGRGKGEGEILLVRKEEEVSALFEKDSLVEKIVIFYQTPPRPVLPKLKVKEVGGMVLPGIHFRDFFTLVDCPLLLTEGFGCLSLGEDLGDIFSRYEGERVLLEGERLLIPETEGSKGGGKVEKELEVGDWVRVIGGAIGFQGEVREIGRRAKVWGSHFSATPVTIEGGGKTLIVPKRNLEILEKWKK